ncbi:MAG: glycine betaine ABC transporter substrate-binding protein [Polyangiaceae bacterium]|nr:glycine betaine ABC transporter substrate-binding protein [Polyangiaceae bacterium]
MTSPEPAAEAAAPKGSAKPEATASESGVAPKPANAAWKRKVRIGWTAWADAEFVTNLAKRILEERMHYDVELVMADVGIQYQGLADGSLDLMLMAWLPKTHANYWKKVAGKVVNLGPLYTGAKLGWAVPDYVPKAQVASLADLKKPGVAEKLSGKIQGIDPGSGLMQVSEQALKDYGLKQQLVSSSGAAMTAALDRAIRRKQWIVVTAWSPHWIFAKWKLRYLEDPKGAFGAAERVHALARQGFDKDYDPKLVGFFTRMFLPLSELEAAMLEASNSNVEKAVDHYVEEHGPRINYWISGTSPTSG